MAYVLSSFLLSIVLVTLSLMSMVGLVWLTQFSFHAEPTGSGADTYTVKNFSKTKLTFCRVTTVLVWVQMALVTLGSLWASVQ